MTSDQRLSTRTHTCYDPAEEIRMGWPDWRLQFTPLGAGVSERFDLNSKTVHIDPAAYAEDPAHALAHIAAHLRYDLDDLRGQMTPLQEANANSVAYLWLDRERV